MKRYFAIFLACIIASVLGVLDAREDKKKKPGWASLGIFIAGVLVGALSVV